MHCAFRRAWAASEEGVKIRQPKKARENKPHGNNYETKEGNWLFAQREGDWKREG